VDEAGEARLTEELRAEFDAAVAAVEAAPPPGPDALFDHAYARPPARLDGQRAIAMDAAPTGARPADRQETG
jgi:TPP-dependent pyruvate/acetoin dehydrogenase alpha subunit